MIDDGNLLDAAEEAVAIIVAPGADGGVRVEREAVRSESDGAAGDAVDGEDRGRAVKRDTEVVPLGVGDLGSRTGQDLVGVVDTDQVKLTVGLHAEGVTISTVTEDDGVGRGAVG